MYVTKKDEKMESDLIRILRPEIWPIVNFEHMRGASVYDFHGYVDGELWCKVDVKVRDIYSKKFEDYFVSEDKVKEFEADPEVLHYLVYYFSVDRRILVFRLDSCRLEDREIEFRHRRAGEEMTARVYCVNRADWLYEFYY